MTFRSTILLLTSLALTALMAMVGTARATSPHLDTLTSASQPERFGWPLAPPHPVTRPFEPPATPYGPGHRGVDLGGPPGGPVVAAGAGVVVFAGPLAGRGVVSIAHAGDLRTTYEPVTALVQPGQRVARGTLIGLLNPGHDTETCLHWGARRGTEYVDLLGLLSTGRVRLLPWDG